MANPGFYIWGVSIINFFQRAKKKGLIKVFFWVLLFDTIGVKKKSHHNFIRVVIFERVTREERNG